MYEWKLKELRERSLREASKNSPKEPVSFWREKDRALGKIVSAFVLILRTRGCSWASSSGGCTMCGYSNDVFPRGPSERDLILQVKKASEAYSGEEYLKIFTSGSFLDEKEIPQKLWKEILSNFEGTQLVSIESRPEYVSLERLSELRRICKEIGAELEVSIGLESSNERVLMKFIHKGFRIEDYVNAARKVRQASAKLKTYVLLKPPFLSEALAIRDCINSICFAANFSEKVSVNPVVVQRNTLVEDLWRRGYYQPPWCFSLLEVLKRSKEEKSETEIVSSPMKKGSRRGLRGCQNCLEKCLRSIGEFSLTQDIKKLRISEKCLCVEKWREEIEIGKKVPFIPRMTRVSPPSLMPESLQALLFSSLPCIP